MRFWDLGRQPEDGIWGTRRSRRMYQTMDTPNLLAVLPRPYRWIVVALWIAAVLLVSLYLAR